MRISILGKVRFNLGASLKVLVGLSLAAFLSPTYAQSTLPKIKVNKAKLDTKTEVQYATAGSEFLGLAGITLNGVLIKSPNTIVPPPFSEAVPQRQWQLMKVEKQAKGLKFLMVSEAFRVKPTPIKDNHYLDFPPVASQEFQFKTIQKLLSQKPVNTNQLADTLVWVFNTKDTLLLGRKAVVLQHYVQTNKPQPFFRYSTSLEIGGNVNNLTLINFRYRGRGKIEESFSNTGPKTYYSTADIWPGKWAKPRQTSGFPFGDSAAMATRSSANLITMPRGGGVAFFDLQAKEDFAILTTRPLYGNFRSLTEAFPNDPYISQTDDEYFQEGVAKRSTPIQYILFIEKGIGNQKQLLRNLWADADSYYRTQHEAQLGLKRYPVQPAIGFNWDYFKPNQSYARAAENLASTAKSYQAAGVKMVLNHNAGWLNGQGAKLGLDGQAKEPFLGSGTCNVYDYKPLPKMETAWKSLYDSLHKYQMNYLIWVTAMAKRKGDFATEVSTDSTHWAMFSPTVDNNVYGKDMVKFNILYPKFKQVYRQRMLAVKQNQGYDGIWYDSWHNLWASSFGFQHAKPEPNHLAWMQELAWWSIHHNLIPMAEGQMSPGLSCTIEVPEWESQPWYFNQTVRWLRNGEHKSYSADSLNRLGFKLLAAGGWLTFDVLEYNTEGPYVEPNTIMPEFSALAKLLNTHQPKMFRRQFLANDAGVQWFNASGKPTLWFSFSGQVPPEGKLLYQYKELACYSLE